MIQLSFWPLYSWIFKIIVARYNVTIWEWCWAFFHMSMGQLFVLHGELSVQALCPSFNWVVCLLSVDSCEFFIYMELNPYLIYHWQICNPIQSVPFSFCWLFFSCEETLKFVVVAFVYFFFYFPCLGRYIGKHTATWKVWNFTAYVFF